MAGGAPLELIAVEVRADIDQLQSQMTGATRVVDANYQQITRSAQQSEQAIVRSATNAGDAIVDTSNRTRQLGQQFSQVGQQIAAGTAPLQALAIQLPDIALAFQSTGAAAGGFAAFMGGPWGIALTTAAAIAAGLVPKILGIGDAADSSRPKVDAMTDALDRLSRAQGRVTREDFGRAQANLLEKQGAVRAARDRRALAGRGIGTAGAIGSADADIRDAQAELKKAADIFNLSKIRLGIQDRTDAANAAADAKSSSKRSRSTGGTRSSGKSDAEREAESTAKLTARQDAQYDKTKAQLELEQRLADLRAQGTESASMLADMLEARARLEQQFPELARSTKEEDQQRLAVLLDIQNAIIGEAYQRKAAQKAADEARQGAEEDARKAAKDIEDIQRQQERQIRTLAGLYQDAFKGGTKAIWGDFKQVGLQVIAEVLARFTLAKLSGGKFDLGGAITSAVGLALPGFASGGDLVIGGRGGTDQNTLSLNGQPFARVSRDETLRIGNSSLGRGSSGTTVIQQTVQVDARNSVNPSGFAQQLLAISNQQAQQAAGAVGKAINKGLPLRLSGFQRDGT